MTSARGHRGAHLDTCTCFQLAQTADERPAAGWDVGDFGDGFHPLRTGDAHLQWGKSVSCSPVHNEDPTGCQLFESYLWYPQSTADMCPFSACTCGLHGAAPLWTEQALGVDAEDTSPAQPVPKRDFDNAITGLGKSETGNEGTTIVRIPAGIVRLFSQRAACEGNPWLPGAHRCCTCHRTPCRCPLHCRGSDRHRR